MASESSQVDFPAVVSTNPLEFDSDEPTNVSGVGPKRANRTISRSTFVAKWQKGLEGVRGGIFVLVLTAGTFPRCLTLASVLSAPFIGRLSTKKRERESVCVCVCVCVCPLGTQLQQKQIRVDQNTLSSSLRYLKPPCLCSFPTQATALRRLRSIERTDSSDRSVNNFKSRRPRTLSCG